MTKQSKGALAFPWSYGMTFQELRHQPSLVRKPFVLYVALTTIERERATIMLANMARNRTVKPQHVRTLLRQIGDGDWCLNGAPILFTGDGQLVDGQHRLTAVVKSGNEIVSLVVVGISYETALTTTDSGMSRSVTDRLTMEGQKSASILAAAANLFWMYRSGDVVFKGTEGRATHPEAVKLGTQDQTLIQAASMSNAESQYWRGFIGVSQVALIRRILWDIDHDAAETFIERLRRGMTDEDPDTDPIWRCRCAIQSRRARGGDGRAGSIVPIVLHAWNLWRTGERRMFIRAPATFPYPK